MTARTGVVRRERYEPHDLDAIRRAHPLPGIVGADVNLVRAGKELKACCPLHSDRTPSFTIYEGGMRWHCFGGCGGGDVFDYLARLHDVGLLEAVEMLTGGSVPTARIAASPVDDSPDRTEEAKAIWRAAAPAPGTLAETYLRSRGLHLPIPVSIRFARLRYGTKGPEHPALVAAVQCVEGKVIGIQRTYLNSAGTGKAAVPKAKLSLGRVSGGAIRLAPCAPSLIVVEGLEDGLTLLQELGLATWVAAGASMLPAMAFPEAVTAVAIGGDNDDAGRRAARKAAEAFAHRGIGSRVFFPAGAKDFNAELTEGTCA